MSSVDPAPSLVDGSLEVLGWIGDNLTQLTLIVAGLWALYSFSRARRSNAARWAVEQFKVFYTDERLLVARRLIEHEYESKLVPMLQLRIINRDVPSRPDHIADKAHFDYFMNFLEQLVYLQKRRELSRRDRDTFFSYWLTLLNEPQHGVLRRYVCRRGFELLARTVTAHHKDHEHVGVYGTLMSTSPRQDQLGIRSFLTLHGTTTVAGTMVELPTCPGLQPDGEHPYEVEIYCVPTKHEKYVFSVLDALEEYFPGKEDSSRFLRRSRWDPTLGLDYWTYYIAKRNVPDDATLITDDSWPTFVARTQKVVPEVPPGIDNFPPAVLAAMAPMSAVAKAALERRTLTTNN